jgi:hypothetical protein
VEYKINATMPPGMLKTFNDVPYVPARMSPCKDDTCKDVCVIETCDVQTVTKYQKSWSRSIQEHLVHLCNCVARYEAAKLCFLPLH